MDSTIDRAYQRPGSYYPEELLQITPPLTAAEQDHTLNAPCSPLDSKLGWADEMGRSLQTVGLPK